MPIIKSAKKAAKQNIVKRVRNLKSRRMLHDVQKDFYDMLKAGNSAEATKEIAKLYKVVDTCAKKNIIPGNRADRLKSKAARALAGATS